MEKYDIDHEIKQKKMQKALVTDENTKETRTTLSLSLKVSDKKALKMIALQRETTIAAIIHEWIQQHLEEAGK